MGDFTDRIDAKRDGMAATAMDLTHRITNAVTEGLNAKIRWIKYGARGFRNREAFKMAIYFHCGG